MRMMHRTLVILPLLLLGALPSLALSADVAQVESLKFETLEGRFTLRGPDARMQLLVTGTLPNSRLTDATRAVTYTSEPQGIVSIDPMGIVKPTGEGSVTVTATAPNGKTAQVALDVKDYAHPPDISFPNQIVPIFTKLGCNGGGCHGKATGQNGFKLSLLGFYPEDDLEFLKMEARGRRVNTSEYYSGAQAWVDELRRLGLRVLMNEHVLLQHGDAALALAGVADYSAHNFDATHRSDPHAAIAGAPEEARVRVLLAHQPRSAPAAAAAGFHLQISGHTHGGQFLPWKWFVRLQQPFTAGLNRWQDLWVYTSRGTGYWGPPKRLGAPSEITHLRLVAA